MLRPVLFILLLFFMCATADAAERPAQLGLCASCHGETGCSKLIGTPHLAAQDRVYLAKALNDYRSGSRQHAAMNAISGSLSSRDVDAFAAWYSAQTATCVQP